MRALSDIVCNRSPIAMRSDATVKDACEQMRDQKSGAVLVTDAGGQLIGIFTGRDAVFKVLATGKSPTRTRLADVMTPDPVTMPAGKTALDALRLMWDGGFRHLPVVEDGEITGVVSRGDFRGEEQLILDDERALWENLR